MNKKIKIFDLLGEMESYALENLKKPEHPVDSLFSSSARLDIAEALNLTNKASQKIDLKELQKILSNSANQTGQRTSIDIDEVISEVLRQTEDSNSYIGKFLSDANSNQVKLENSSINKSDFISAIDDKVKTDPEFKYFEASLPERLVTKNDIDHALDNIFGSDYDDELRDLVQEFDKIKEAIINNKEELPSNSIFLAEPEVTKQSRFTAPVINIANDFIDIAKGDKQGKDLVIEGMPKTQIGRLMSKLSEIGVNNAVISSSSVHSNDGKKIPIIRIINPIDLKILNGIDTIDLNQDSNDITKQITRSSKSKLTS